MLVTLERARLEPALAEITDDALLTERITSAQLQIEGWCHRKFELQEHTDVIYTDGEARRSIFLPQFPVTEVREIEIVNRDYTSTVYSLEDSAIVPDGFYLRQDTGELIAINKIYFNEVRVTYTAGFDPVPADVQEACLKLLILTTYDGSIDAEYGNVSMMAESIADYSYKAGLIDNSGGDGPVELIPLSVRSLIYKYKVILV